MRCALYTEPFAFIGGNLHNNTKSAKSNNSQFYATSRNKSRKKVCLALYTTSVHIHQYKWHQSSVMQLVYDHDWKFVAFSRVFRWHGKFHEEFSFRLCKTTIHSLIFWSFGFLNKCRKIWKRILRSWKYFPQRHLESYHMDSKSSSRTPRSWKCYRRCANRSRSIVKQKTAEESEENSIKLDVSLIRCNIKWFVSTPVIDFRAGRARIDISAEFFQEIIFRQEWRWNAFFFKIGVCIIHGCPLYTGKYGNSDHNHQVT